MGNNSILLQQSVWVTPWVLRPGLRAGGRLDETRKPTVREKQQGLRVSRAVVEVWEHGPGLAGQSSLGWEAELGSLVRSIHGEQWLAGWLSPAPRWKVPGTGRFHLPCLVFHGKWAPSYQKKPSQPLLIHRTHPDYSRTHIEKTGRGPEARYPSRSLPSSPCPSS